MTGAVQKTQSEGPFLTRAGAYIASHTDPLKKVAKILIALINIAIPFGGGSLAPLKGRLTWTKDVIDAVGIFERGKEWASPKDRAAMSKLKTANRASLTVAAVFDFGIFIDKVSANFFFRKAMMIGAALPIVELVRNIFVCGGSIFSIGDSSVKIHEARKKVKGIVSKKRTWTALQASRGTDSAGVTANLKAKYERKMVAVAGNAAKTAKIQKYLVEIGKGDSKSLIDHKISLYKTREHNNLVERKKCWVTIAAEIAKIFIVSLFTVIFFLGVNGLLPVDIFSNSMTVVTEGIGLGKSIYLDKELGAKARLEPAFAA